MKISLGCWTTTADAGIRTDIASGERRADMVLRGQKFPNDTGTFSSSYEYHLHPIEEMWALVLGLQFVYIRIEPNFANLDAQRAAPFQRWHVPHSFGSKRQSNRDIMHGWHASSSPPRRG